MDRSLVDEWMARRPRSAGRRTRRLAAGRVAKFRRIGTRAAPMKGSADCVDQLDARRHDGCFSLSLYGMNAPDRRLRTVTEGSPYPRGAHWDGKGVNFALFSASATKVEVCLFDAG